MRYELIVGNVGVVWKGLSSVRAHHEFDVYVDLSQRGRGRAAGESVVLMGDGEPIREYVACADAVRKEEQ